MEAVCNKTECMKQSAIEATDKIICRKEEVKTRFKRRLSRSSKLDE
jgi:hypothetical protein